MKRAPAAFRLATAVARLLAEVDHERRLARWVYRPPVAVGKVDIVAAGIDQVESVGVGSASSGTEVVGNLRDCRDRLLEAAGIGRVFLHILGAAGRKIRAARLIGGARCEPEVCRQHLGVHATGTAGRRAGARGHGGGPRIVEILLQCTGRRQRFEPAAIDGAIPENDGLIELLGGRGRRQPKGQDAKPHARRRTPRARPTNACIELPPHGASRQH